MVTVNEKSPEICMFAVMIDSERKRKEKQTKWIIDSGATAHMSNEISSFSLPWKNPDVSVASANGSITTARAIEDICVMTTDEMDKTTCLTLSNTLLVPGLIGNIVSISQLTKEGYRVEFNSKECIISRKQEVKVRAHLKNGHFTIFGWTDNKEDKSGMECDEMVTMVKEDLDVKEVPLNIEEPNNWEDMKSLPPDQQDMWHKSMKTEMNILQEANVWEVVKKHAGDNVLKCRWIYKVKMDENQAPNSLRARLVVKGYGQRPGVDYSETYAPVVRHSTVRALLTMAGHENLKTKHCDVRSAFLYGNLEEDIYVEYPMGPWKSLPKGECLKLKQAVYGLKQAAHAWNVKIDNTLTDFGMVKSSADECLYIKKDCNIKTYAIIHVDDILIFSNDEMSMKELYNHINAEYELKDLGEVKMYLGINIVKNPTTGTYSINQNSKINKLVKDTGLIQGKEKTTPMVPEFSRSMVESKSPTLMDNIKYQQVIGSLMYLSLVTRPDITVAVNILGRAVSKPTRAHWEALKDIIRYLKSTSDYCLNLDGRGSVQLEAYCDADWGGDLKDRHSTSGGVYLMGKSVIGWGSKKQRCVSLSTAEAEYVSLSDASREMIWLIKLMNDLDVKCALPVVMNCDSQSCISLAKGDGISSRTKHIDIRNHFSREQIKMGNLKVIFCPTESMLADMFTKPLGRSVFTKFREQLQMHKKEN